jgi:hypothetical protein
MIILLLKIIRFNSLYIVPSPSRWSTYAQQPLWGTLLALSNIHVIFSFRNGRRSRRLIAVVDLWSHESRQERMGWQHQLIGTRERRPDALAGTRLQYSLARAMNYRSNQSHCKKFAGSPRSIASCCAYLLPDPLVKVSPWWAPAILFTFGWFWR